MKDYHCHILPIDDGASSMENGAELAAYLVKRGFSEALCTPHIAFLYRNNPNTIRQAYEELKVLLEVKNIPLSITYSAEYRFIPETWNDVKANNWLLPWEGNHLLIEFPIRDRDGFKGINYDEEIDWLIARDIQPVLAHPERYLYLSLEELAKIKSKGVLFQMNYGSPQGQYGDDIKARAAEIEREFAVEFRGTDLHRLPK